MTTEPTDAVALARYKVVPAHESMFHRFAVVAGDGKQQLYLGREVECENMARKFVGAFLDGAFYQANITPSTQAAESVPAVEREQQRITYPPGQMPWKARVMRGTTGGLPDLSHRSSHRAT